MPHAHSQPFPFVLILFYHAGTNRGARAMAVPEHPISLSPSNAHRVWRLMNRLIEVHPERADPAVFEAARAKMISLGLQAGYSAAVRRHMVPEAAILEMRAQIERAIDAGMRPSHIDAHMAAAMLPELLGAHVQLGREYGVFPVLPRSIFWPPDITAYRESVAALDAERAPVIDHCRGTLAVDPAELANLWKDVLSELPPGVTHLALHCTAPGEF